MAQCETPKELSCMSAYDYERWLLFCEPFHKIYDNRTRCMLNICNDCYSGMDLRDCVVCETQTIGDAVPCWGSIICLDCLREDMIDWDLTVNGYKPEGVEQNIETLINYQERYKNDQRCCWWLKHVIIDACEKAASRHQELVNRRKEQRLFAIKTLAAGMMRMVRELKATPAERLAERVVDIWIKTSDEEDAISQAQLAVDEPEDLLSALINAGTV